jgi:predicted permease
MWLTFCGSWLLFALLGRAWHWPKRRVGALALVAGFGNTSFMGYPIMLALHGKPGLALAVVADQVGSFPLLAVGGVLVASLCSGSEVRPKAIARNLLAFPSFIALFVALAVGLLGGWPQAVVDTLNAIGDTMTPLSLFSVGMQFRLQIKSSQWGPLSAALGWKLLLAPLLVWALGWAAGVGGLNLTVSVLQAGMAPMISAAILADQYKLDPPLANTVLGAGILLSMVTVPLLNLGLGG